MRTPITLFTTGSTHVSNAYLRRHWETQKGFPLGLLHPAAGGNASA